MKYLLGLLGYMIICGLIMGWTYNVYYERCGVPQPMPKYEDFRMALFAPLALAFAISVERKAVEEVSECNQPEVNHATKRTSQTKYQTD